MQRASNSLNESSEPRLIALRFGPFELDVRSGELRRNGTTVRLQPQPLKVLLLLAGRPGEVVTREEIQAEIWPAGTFVDFAPLHLITTATLDRIAELSPYRHVRLERYRPNVVIGTEDGGFTENDWLGRDLRVGDDLVLRVIARTPRCAIPTLAHGDLPRDTEALRVVARHNRVRPLPEADPEPCAIGREPGIPSCRRSRQRRRPRGCPHPRSARNACSQSVDGVPDGDGSVSGQDLGGVAQADRGCCGARADGNPP